MLQLCSTAIHVPHVAPLHPALPCLPSTLAQGTCLLETGMPCTHKHVHTNTVKLCSLSSHTDGYIAYHSVGVSPSLYSMRWTMVGGARTGETPKSKLTAALVLTGTRRRVLHRMTRERQHGTSRTRHRGGDKTHAMWTTYTVYVGTFTTKCLMMI